MKNTVFLVLLVFCLSCVEHAQNNDVSSQSYQEQLNINVKYAKGFTVNTTDSNFTKIIINSGESEFNFSDSIYIPHTTSFDQKGKKTLNNKIQSLGLQSSTYLAYLEVLNKTKLVKGICGLEYVSNKNLIKKLKNNQALEMSMSGKIQNELLLKVNPDLFLIYPYELGNANKYNEQGINTLLISEYLEETPLARLEWIKLFGLLVNETELANTYFDNIEKQYQENVRQSTIDKTLIFNLPFKDNWNMPSSNSFVSNLTKDVGLNYIYNDGSYDNIVRSKEIVWNDGVTADYWIIIANRPIDFDLNQLIEEDQIYADFKSVKNHKVIFCNATITDYFTVGVVEPDIMLKDLLFATGQIKNHTPKYFKLLN